MVASTTSNPVSWGVILATRCALNEMVAAASANALPNSTRFIMSASEGGQHSTDGFSQRHDRNKY
jgi:hypothetical protein